MEILVTYLGGERFESIVRGHRLDSDQPLENHGRDTAATPPELFLFSLASCAGFYAAEYLNARALPSDGLEIRVSGDKGDQPARFVSIRMQIVAPGLTKHHRDGVMRAVQYCLISNTLTRPPNVEVSVIASPDQDLVGV